MPLLPRWSAGPSLATTLRNPSLLLIYLSKRPNRPHGCPPREKAMSSPLPGDVQVDNLPCSTARIAGRAGQRVRQRAAGVRGWTRGGDAPAGREGRGPPRPPVTAPAAGSMAYSCTNPLLELRRSSRVAEPARCTADPAAGAATHARTSPPLPGPPGYALCAAFTASPLSHKRAHPRPAQAQRQQVKQRRARRITPHMPLPSWFKAGIGGGDVPRA